MNSAPSLAAAISAVQGGNAVLAANLARAAAEAMPRAVEAHHVLAIALTQLGRFEEAGRAFGAALALAPDDAGLHHDFGSLLLRAGRRVEAAAAFLRAIAIRPDYAAAHAGLAAACGGDGRLDEAVAAMRRALELNPDDWANWNSLAGWLRESGRYAEAERAYRNAARLAPGSAYPRNNLGNLYRRWRRPDDAKREFEAALRLDPANATIREGLAMALVEAGDHAGALSCILDTNPWHPAVPWALSGLLYAETDAERIAHWHREFGRRIEVCRRPPSAGPRPAKLRIGYLSADLHHHPVGWFLRPLLRNHDRSRFEIFIYDTQATGLVDELTTEIKGLGDQWRILTDAPADEAADIIRGDDLDLLIDTGGHTSSNRLDIMARCPAPRQASYLGYPGSTGLAAIDYLITDSVVAPVGKVEHHYTEKLVRLDRPFFVYEPPLGEGPAAGPLPALNQGCITFGAFHSANKLLPEMLARWSEILRRVSGSRLLINAPALGDEEAAKSLRLRFEAHGIGAERLHLVGFLPLPEHFALYDRVDIMLDSFPWNGHTSAINALWHGVPLVVQSGGHHAARMGETILKPLGMAEWIAGSAEAYVDIAVRMAGDPERLATLRANLRPRLRESPFFDHRGFVAEFESRLQAMCRNA